MIDEKGPSVTLVIMSSECTEPGVPRKLGVYHIEARQIGQLYCAPVLVLREHAVQAPRLPVLSLAPTAGAALAEAVRHYEEFAKQHGFSVQTS